MDGVRFGRVVRETRWCRRVAVCVEPTVSPVMVERGSDGGHE